MDPSTPNPKDPICQPLFSWTPTSPLAGEITSDDSNKTYTYATFDRSWQFYFVQGFFPREGRAVEL
ncbi:MAG: hypothetical protein WBX01_12215 [Nitrososphaeraceae archaeon]